MNVLVLVSFILISTGFMMIVIDHHYYHAATVACLEKKIQNDYEADGRALYEWAHKQKKQTIASVAYRPNPY